MSDDDLAPESVAARLCGLSDIIAALKQRYQGQNASDADAADMLQGAVETLADLRRLWPDDDDAMLIMRAREMQGNRSAVDLLHVALSTEKQQPRDCGMPFVRRRE